MEQSDIFDVVQICADEYPGAQIVHAKKSQTQFELEFSPIRSIQNA